MREGWWIVELVDLKPGTVIKKRRNPVDPVRNNMGQMFYPLKEDYPRIYKMSLVGEPWVSRSISTALGHRFLVVAIMDRWHELSPEKLFTLQLVDDKGQVWRTGNLMEYELDAYFEIIS